LALKVIRLSKICEGAHHLSRRTPAIQVPNPLHTAVDARVRYRQSTAAIRMKRVDDFAAHEHHQGRSRCRNRCPGEARQQGHHGVDRQGQDPRGALQVTAAGFGGRRLRVTQFYESTASTDARTL
jgi:hypothetical protein